jgi:dipeptidyl aminopeptidase/acylaminoacyl peptidase
MIRRLMGVCVIALALGAAGVPGVRAQEKAEKKEARSKAGKKLLTAMDALRIANVGAPRVSPDGARLAYTVSQIQMEKDKEWKAVTHVWVVPAAGPASAARQFTRGDKNAVSPAWSPDGKYLAFLSAREKEGEQQVWMMHADGGEAWQVTAHKGGVSAFAFSPNGKSLLLTAQDQPTKDEEQKKKDKDDTILINQNIKMSHLWLWDIEAKEGKRLTEGNWTVSDARWSPDGAHVSYTVRPTPRADDGDLTDIWILTVASGEKRRLISSDAPESNARWSPDGQWIAFNGSARAGGVYQGDLFLVPSSGGAARNLTGGLDLDAGVAFWAADGKSIFFTSNIRQAIEVFSVEVASGRTAQLSQRGGVVTLGDLAPGGQLFGTIGGPMRPAEIYRSNSAFTTLAALSDHNAWLNDYELAASEVVKWKSRDGMDIEGVLTKPVDFDASRKYAFLLNPHGGPTGASLMSFNGTLQTLAANGFLILQPNFRGSTGRGEAFAQANKNTWGKGDYEDCITGVEEMVARGWAHQDRLGAFGWSYGGYMTFWILTQTDMFKAVSPGAGLTNIYSMYSQNDIQRYLRWFYADVSPWDNPDLYWDRSPMKYVKNVKTPTMIMHGQQDARVPIAQAQEFYRALLERNVPVEFVVFPREGHGIAEPRHQLDRIRRYVSFFAKYLNNPTVTEATP